jgi:polyferredoxin
LIRPRTLIYLAVMVIAVSVVATALLTRSQQMLFVGHDRAPLYVMLPDGTARNGYNIVVSNKTLDDIRYVLRLDGVPGATMRFAEQQDAPSDHLSVTVAPDSIGTFRVLVIARPRAAGDSSAPLDVILTRDDTGERTTYRSVFMGPGS